MNATGFTLLFGIVLLPVYLMLFGWFLGKPRDLRLPLVGTGVLVGLVVLAWGGLYLAELAFRPFY